MEVGVDLIVVFKTNRKLFYKETIKKITRDCPGGSNIVLSIRPIVPRVSPIIDIGYKCNARKVLSFIVTYNTGITQTSITYLSK